MTTSSIRALLFSIASISCGACGAEVTVIGDDSAAEASVETCDTYCEAFEACDPKSRATDCETRCLDEYERQGDPEITCGPTVRRRLQCIAEAYETVGCEGFKTACRAEADAVANCP